MKSVLYIHRTQGGGVEGVHIRGTIDCLRDLGYSVDVVSPDSDSHAPSGSSSEWSNMRRRLMARISQATPEVLFEFMEIAYNVHAITKVKRLIRDMRPKLLYERYAIFSIVGAYHAERQGIPLVLEVNYTSLSPLVRKRSRILSPLAARFDRYIFSKATSLVVVSSVLKRELIAYFDISPARIVVVPNACDPDSFSPKQKTLNMPGINRAKRYIGFVGGFYPWHGLDLLLDAFGRVASEFPDVDLMLIGDGPESDKIVARAEKMGLQERVQMPGRLPHSSISNMIDAFYVGVMPDSNNYGSPMKLFEYMALGKAIIAPDYEPIAEIMDGQGYMFEQENAHSLAVVLREALSHPDMVSLYGKRGRELVETQYNWRANTERVLQHLATLEP